MSSQCKECIKETRRLYHPDISALSRRIPEGLKLCVDEHVLMLNPPLKPLLPDPIDPAFQRVWIRFCTPKPQATTGGMFDGFRFPVDTSWIEVFDLSPVQQLGGVFAVDELFTVDEWEIHGVADFPKIPTVYFRFPVRVTTVAIQEALQNKQLVSDKIVHQTLVHTFPQTFMIDSLCTLISHYLYCD